VWLVPLLVALAAAAWHRRSVILSLATVALFAAFADLDPMPWPGRHPGLLRILAGNLYVLCALAILVTAALLLAGTGSDRDHASGPCPPTRPNRSRTALERSNWHDDRGWTNLLAKEG
jgi:hypothetical protein